MDRIELYVIFGDRATEEWKNVVKLDIEPHIQPDFSIGPEAIKKQEREIFREVLLPNGETIELAVLYRQEAENFSLDVKQGTEPLLQVLCEGMPNVVFRTLAGASINIQVHSRGYFEASNGHHA